MTQQEAALASPELEQRPPPEGSLWRTPGFPHLGWTCVGLIDVREDDEPDDEPAYETCDACFHYPIRFVHTLTHPEWPESIDTGCVCASKLTGDYEQPRERERALRKQSTSRRRWLARNWHTSAAGNSWLKVNAHHVVVFLREDGQFGAVIDGYFSPRQYSTEREAMLACHDCLIRHRMI
jgi:hypothetical protein